MGKNNNGLLVCAGTSAVKNIGDYIQSVAQEQFYDKIDLYVERESLDTFCSAVKTNVIMNAWFMWNPEHFPPSDSIEPLFISMHIVPAMADRMLSPVAVSYLKRYEPIGARDFGTRQILESHGIKSYFSGCLTLTLGLKYKNDDKDDAVYFVDPYYELGGGKRRFIGDKYICSFFMLMKHWTRVRRIKDRFAYEFKTGLSRYLPRLDRLLHLASFYDAYSKVFDDEVLFSARYIKHEVEQARFHYDNDEKMEYARQLVRKYAKARLVVTSRIHCALPCLGVETPVIFVTSDNLEKGAGRGGSNGRFSGLTELLNQMKYTSSGVRVVTESLQGSLDCGKITGRSVVSNNETYRPICESLIKTVTEFLGRE